MKLQTYFAAGRVLLFAAIDFSCFALSFTDDFNFGSSRRKLVECRPNEGQVHRRPNDIFKESLVD